MIELRMRVHDTTMPALRLRGCDSETVRDVARFADGLFYMGFADVLRLYVDDEKLYEWKEECQKG